MFQQKTSVLFQQKTSVLFQQKTCPFSTEHIFSVGRAEICPLPTIQIVEASDKGSGPKSPKWPEMCPEWSPAQESAKMNPTMVPERFRPVPWPKTYQKGPKPRNRPVRASALGFDSSGVLVVADRNLLILFLINPNRSPTCYTSL